MMGLLKESAGRTTTHARVAPEKNLRTLSYGTGEREWKDDVEVHQGQPNSRGPGSVNLSGGAWENRAALGFVASWPNVYVVNISLGPSRCIRQRLDLRIRGKFLGLGLGLANVPALAESGPASISHLSRCVGFTVLGDAVEEPAGHFFISHSGCRASRNSAAHRAGSG